MKKRIRKRNKENYIFCGILDSGGSEIIFDMNIKVYIWMYIYTYIRIHIDMYEYIYI